MMEALMFVLMQADETDAGTPPRLATDCDPAASEQGEPGATAQCAAADYRHAEEDLAEISRKLRAAALQRHIAIANGNSEAWRLYDPGHFERFKASHKAWADYRRA